MRLEIDFDGTRWYLYYNEEEVLNTFNRDELIKKIDEFIKVRFGGKDE